MEQRREWGSGEKTESRGWRRGELTGEEWRRMRFRSIVVVRLEEG